MCEYEERAIERRRERRKMPSHFSSFHGLRHSVAGGLCFQRNSPQGLSILLVIKKILALINWFSHEADEVICIICFSWGHCFYSGTREQPTTVRTPKTNNPCLVITSHLSWNKMEIIVFCADLWSCQGKCCIGLDMFWAVSTAEIRQKGSGERQLSF